MRKLKTAKQPYAVSQYLKTLAISCTAVFTAQNSAALNYDFTVFGETEHESNSTLTQPKHADLSSTIGGSLSANQENAKLTFNTEYDITYTDYKNDSLTSRTQANGSSQFRLALIERYLSWDLAHGVVELTSNRNDADTPDNRRRRQNITTGPTLRLPFGDVDEFVLSANYGHVDFNNAESSTATTANPDSEEFSGTASWQHALSPISNVTINYRYAELERDNLQRTTKFHTAYIGYSKQLQHANYRLQVGSNSSKTGSAPKKNNAYFLGEYSKNVGVHQFSLSASQQKTSSALGITGFNVAALRNSETGTLDGLAITQQNFEVSDSIDISFFEASYEASILCDNCSYSLSYSYVDNDFEVDDRSNQVNAFSTRFRYRFNRQFSSQLTSGYTQTDFDPTSSSAKITNKDTSTTLRFTWQHSPKLSFRLGGRYQSRGSNSNTNFDNTTAFIAFDYSMFSGEI